MADLGPSTRGPPAINQYVQAVACFVRAQGPDPAPIDNPRPIASSYATAFTGTRIEPAGVAAGVQITGWHDNPLADLLYIANGHRVVDLSVSVVLAAKATSSDLRGVEHTKASRKDGSITTPNVKPDTPTEPIAADGTSAETSYFSSRPCGAQWRRYEPINCRRSRNLFNAVR